MPRVSPTLEGFRAAFRRPSLIVAEIAWRWTVGAVAWALFLFSFIEYLNSLPVTNADAVLLWTRQPLLVARAVVHILRGSLNRAVLAVLLALTALSLLWIAAASLGRAATVRVLLDYFRIDVCRDDSTTDDAIKPRPLRSLIGLNFLRVALGLAALPAFAGAAILVSFTSPAAKPHPGVAFLLFLPLAALICLVCWALNWLLSLAGIFAIRDGNEVLSALFAAVTFIRKYSAPVFAVSTWTGVAHLAAFSLATTAVSLPLAFIRVGPARFIIGAVIFVTLAYFAVADWLYMARLAGYVCIAEMPEEPVESVTLPAPPDAGQNVILSAPVPTIDRDELMLSDIPN